MLFKFLLDMIPHDLRFFFLLKRSSNAILSSMSAAFVVLLDIHIPTVFMGDLNGTAAPITRAGKDRRVLC